jgi:hypothetical protein
LDVTKPFAALLNANAPAWAHCESRSERKLIVTASVERAGAVMSRVYKLAVVEDEIRVAVKEAAGYHLLPSACAERHINRDGTFCIGLLAGKSIEDDGAAGEWWTQLQVFLLGQEVARDSGFWPEYAQLSHGEAAAQLQLQAEDTAHELNVLDEYNEAVRADSGPIFDLLKLVRPKFMRLRNGRAYCVCGRVNKGEWPLLRRDCWKAELPCLPVLEVRRRKAVADFWKAERAAGVRCCGTMKNCPLRR